MLSCSCKPDGLKQRELGGIPWLACFSVPQQKTITVLSSPKNLWTDLEQVSPSVGKGLGTEEADMVIYLEGIAALPHLQRDTFISTATTTAPHFGSLAIPQRTRADFLSSPSIHQLESHKDRRWLLLIIINFVFVSEASFRFDKNLPLLSWMVRGSPRPGEPLSLSRSSPGR